MTEEGIGRHVCDVCLYEEEVTIPKLDSEPALRLTDENGDYRLYASNGGLSAWIWVGSYKNGRLIDAKRAFVRTFDCPIIDISVSELELSISGADEIRAFMFHQSIAIKPLMPAAKLRIAE